MAKSTIRTRYILHPGPIRSPNDGERHDITFTQLARCYGLRLGECIDANFSDGYAPTFLNKLIHLWPRDKGDYAEHLAFLQKEAS